MAQANTAAMMALPLRPAHGEVHPTFDHYAELGIPETASAQEIRTAYRQLALVRHPDRNPNDPTATASFQRKWKRLESALRDIHEKNASGLSFEQLYRYAYKIVLKKAGDRLCENVKQFEERWFTDKVCPRIFKLISRNLVAMTLNDVPGSPRE
ncbi:Cullin-domain-containing protein [Apiospora marii]|uniref:Cullin-domain-containing protein n=1 Tax=Apiospora marii TaxID=335849 RepID=UPI003132618D